MASAVLSWPSGAQVDVDAAVSPISPTSHPPLLSPRNKPSPASLYYGIKNVSEDLKTGKQNCFQL